MHEANDYFYRFIQDLNSPEFTTLRQRLKGVDLGYHQADQTAEAQVGADDTAENPAKDPYVKFVADLRGVNPSDPWAIAKANPKRRLAAVPRDGLSSNEVHALNQVQDQIETETFTALYKNFIGSGIELADQALDKYKYMDTRKPMLKGGVNYAHHLESVMALMQTAKQQLDIGLFQLEHPTVISSIKDISAKVATHVTLNNPYGLGNAAAFGHQYLMAKAGGNLRVNMPQKTDLWDHFKFYAADIDNPGRDSAFILGSANATLAAMGYPKSAIGSNLESMFTLEYGMVESNQITEKTFYSLMKQAQAARDWIHSGRHVAPDFSNYVDPSMRSLSKLMGTGVTWAEHQALLNRSGAGTTIRIMNFEIGSTYADQLAEAIKNGATVEIITGVAHVDNDSKTTETVRVLQNLRQSLEGSLTEEQIRQRLKVVQSPGFIHSKTTIYSFANGESVMILGSTNLTGGSLRGYHGDWFNPATGKVEGPYKRDPGVTLTMRDLDIMLHGSEYDLGQEIEKFEGLAYGASLYKKQANLAFMDVDQGNKLEEAFSVRRLAKDKGVNPHLVRITDVLDPVTGGLYGKTVTIGGVYQTAAGSLNTGDILSFRVSQMDGGRSKTIGGLATGDQLFIPELGKLITPVRGVMVKRPLEAGEVLEELVRDYSAYEVLAAGVGYLNNEILALLDTPGFDLKTLATSDYMKGRFRRVIRQKFRNIFANFEGLERGELVYDTRRFARLAFDVDYGSIDDPWDRALLNLTGHAKGEGIDAFTIEASKSEQFNRSLHTSEHMRRYEIGGPVFYRAGGLSNARPSSDRSSAARLFDLPGLAATLPIAAQLADDDYFFMLPTSKIIQMAQRIGNIMSTRHLSTPVDDKGNRARSLLVGSGNVDPDTGEFIPDKATEGIRLAGFMALGLGGDIAYFDAGQLPKGKFGTNWDKTIKVSTSQVDPTSLNTLEKTLVGMSRDAKGGVEQISGTRKFKISAETLKKLGHKLPILRLIGEGSGINITQELMFPTYKLEGASPELILDMDKLSSEVRSGMLHLHMEGEILRTLQTGDRIMLGIKAPLMFVEAGSELFKQLKSRAAHIDAELFNKWDLHNANVIFGSSNLKTGDALIQTGLELIKTLDRGKLVDTYDDVLAKIVRPDSQFAGLFERFKDYLNPSAIKEIDIIMGRARGGQLAALGTLLAETQNQLAKGPIAMDKHHAKFIAAAFLAFGIHAQLFLDSSSRYYEKFSMARDAGIADADLEKLKHFGIDPHVTSRDKLPFGITSFVPIYAVSGVSSMSTTMSSRDRVNYLNYHGGEYTDAFLDMMYLDDRVQNRNKAFIELIGVGALHGGAASELIIGGIDDTPMSRYMTGLHNEFIELTAIRRFLEGKTYAPEGSKMGGLTIRQARARLKKLEDKLNQVQSATTIGGYQSTYIHKFLQAEAAAGVGARTLLIPELGSRDRYGRFNFDNNATTGAFREVKLPSPKALLQLGSFEDYSLPIQELYVEIIQKLPLMNEIFRNAKIGPMTEDQREEYAKFRGLVGSFEEEVMGLLATDYQKMLGGQLAVSGQNMIVGTHHELPRGYMVVGDEAFKAMKAGVRQDIIKYAKQAGLTKKEVADFLVKEHDLQRTARMEALETRTMQVQGNLDAVYASRRRKVKTAQETKGPEREARSKLGNLEKAKQQAADAYLDYVIEQLMDNEELRNQYMKGVYQRAGAPMGPLGVVPATRVITFNEFNEQFAKLAPMALDHSNRSVLLSLSGMMFNLGDFDGDTASVSRLSTYAGMKLLDMMGKLNKLSDDELGTYRSAQHELSRNIDERFIAFGEAYTGGSQVFRAIRADLYRSVRDTHKNMSQDRAMKYFNNIEANEKKLITQAAAGDKEAQERLADLEAYRIRRQQAHGLAVGTVKFSMDILGQVGEAESFITDKVRNGLTREQAFNEYMRSQALTSSVESLTKVASTLVDTKKGSIGTSALTSNEILALVTAVNWAATFLIGKTFETAFAIQTYFGAQRGAETASIARAIRSLDHSSLTADGMVRSTIANARHMLETTIKSGDDLEVPIRSLVDKYDAANAKFTSIQGIVLLAQQMARDAIKPKTDTGAIGALRASMVGGDYVPSGINFARNMPRTRALEALTILVEGKDFSPDLDEKGHRLSSVGDITPDMARKLHGDIVTGFTDYFMDSAEGMYAYGATTEGFFENLLRVGPDGKSLMTRDDLAKALTIAGKADGLDINTLIGEDGTINKDALGDLGPEEARTLVKAHLGDRAKEIADAALFYFNNPSIRDYRQQYLSYKSGLAPGVTPEEFFQRANQIDPRTKLAIFAGVTSRHHGYNAQNMALAIEDIMQDWSSSKDLRRAAEQATDSVAFAENLERIHEVWSQRGNVDMALASLGKQGSMRMSALEQVIESHEELEAIKIKQDKSEADVARQVELQEKLDKIDIKESRQELEAWRGITKIQDRLGLRTRSITRSIMSSVTDSVINHLSSSAGLHVSSNLLGAAVFAGLGSEMSSSDEGNSASAAAFVSAATMTAPGMIGSMLTQSKQPMLHAGILALSVGAGMMAAEASGRIARGMVGPQLERMATAAASSVGAAVVGMTVGALLEGLSRKLGLADKVNPLVQPLAQLTGKLSDDFGEHAEGIAEDELDEFAGITGEETVIWDATGEILGFWHTDAGDGNSDVSEVQGDIDTAIVSYEEASTPTES